MLDLLNFFTDSFKLFLETDYVLSIVVLVFIAWCIELFK